MEIMMVAEIRFWSQFCKRCCYEVCLKSKHPELACASIHALPAAEPLGNTHLTITGCGGIHFQAPVSKKTRWLSHSSLKKCRSYEPHRCNLQEDFLKYQGRICIRPHALAGWWQGGAGEENVRYRCESGFVPAQLSSGTCTGHHERPTARTG